MAVANLRPRVEMIRYPRAVLCRFPRGATMGAPGDAAQQRAVLGDALDLLRTAREPATWVDLPHRFTRE